MAKCCHLCAGHLFMYVFSVAYGHWGIALVRQHCIGRCTGVHSRRHQELLDISFSFSKGHNRFYFEVELNFMTPPRKACRKNFDAYHESAP